MKSLKYIATLSLLLATLSAEAKIKVVESSQRREPEWVNSTLRESIITSAISSDIESAKRECIDDVKRQIIAAVAQNITSSSSSRLEQKIENRDVIKFLDSYTQSSDMQSAKVPFISGISLSKAEEFYWERRRDTESDEISYLYVIKYPFSEVELNQLVAKFEKQDQEMMASYRRLESKFLTVSSIVDVDVAIVELGRLVEYFFDDVRRNAAIALRDSYSSIYRSVTIAELSNELGDYRFAFMYDGREMQVKTKPRVESETLYELVVEREGRAWSVKYKYDVANPDEINAAKITAYVHDNKLTHTLYADVRGSMISIKPTQRVEIEGVVGGERHLSSLNIRLNMECNLTSPVVVTQLHLNVPTLATPIFMDNLDVELSGDGIQVLKLDYTSEIDVLRSQNGRQGMLNGYLVVTDRDHKRHNIKISLPYRGNW